MKNNKVQNTRLKIKNLISENGYKENIPKWQLQHFSSLANPKEYISGLKITSRFINSNGRGDIKVFYPGIGAWVYDADIIKPLLATDFNTLYGVDIGKKDFNEFKSNLKERFKKIPSAKIKNIAQQEENKYIAEFKYKGEERRIEIHLQKDAANFTPPEYDILYISNSWFDFNQEVTKKISHNWLKNLDKENGIFLHQNVVGSTKPLFEDKNSAQKFLTHFSKIDLGEILEEEKEDKIITLTPTIYRHTP